ncbi:MAG: M24 family metallopeptidase [Planctomycetales bacterium]
MPTDRHAIRRQGLLARLREAGIPALLVSNETNVGYLTGFTGDSSYLLLGPGVCTLISDGRYTTQIRQECPDLEASIRPQSETIVAAAAKLAKQARLKRLGVEADHLSMSAAEKLATEVKGLELAATSGWVEDLRQVKDAGEIQEIRSAIRMAEKGFAVLRAELRGELTEREVSDNLEQAMRRFGARGCAFPTIVAVGPRGALPHARPTSVRVAEDNFLLVDWGAEAPSGYKSDLTRIIATGSISPKLERVYRVVLKAQQAAIKAIRPGVRCCDVDVVARRVIDGAGFGKHFTHGLGHGFGLNIHEWPRFSVSCETPLAAGMVVTVEPGIYLEGWGGVRIEDDVLVTRGGCEVLTSVPKDLADIVLR